MGLSSAVITGGLALLVAIAIQVCWRVRGRRYDGEWLVALAHTLVLLLGATLAPAAWEQAPWAGGAIALGSYGGLAAVLLRTLDVLDPELFFFVAAGSAMLLVVPPVVEGGGALVTGPDAPPAETDVAAGLTHDLEELTKSGRELERMLREQSSKMELVLAAWSEELAQLAEKVKELTEKRDRLHEDVVDLEGVKEKGVGAISEVLGDRWFVIMVAAASAVLGTVLNQLVKLVWH